MRDAELAEVLARGAESAHVVRGEKGEAGVGTAGAIGKHGIARKYAEAAQAFAEGIDVVRVGADAGDHVGVSCLHGAQRPPQRDNAARAAERNMVEPAYREPEMLGEPDRSVRSQREAADAQAVDVGLVELGGLQQAGESLRDKPVCVADGIADVRDRHRRDERQIAIVSRADA